MLTLYQSKDTCLYSVVSKPWRETMPGGRDDLCGFNWLWWILQKEWCFLGDPACFLAGDITVSSSGCSTIMIKQMLFSFLSCWGFCTFFFFLNQLWLSPSHWVELQHGSWSELFLLCPVAEHSGPSWAEHVGMIPLTPSSSMLYHDSQVTSRGASRDWLFWGAMGRECTRTSLCLQWSIPACPPQKWHTLGIFLLWMLITLANDTDMGGALSFLEKRVKIQNVDQVEKSPVIQKRTSTKL